MDVRKRLFLFFLSLGLFAFAAGCSDPATDPPVDGTKGSLVVGVTTDLRVGVDIKRLRVVMRQNGEVIRDDTLDWDAKTLKLPTELPFRDVADGTPVEVFLEAFTGSSSTALVSRSASSTIVAGKTLLLRVAIQSACVVHPGTGGPTFCEEALTCVSGECVDPAIDAKELEAYDPAWNQSAPDICKAAGAGDPIVIVGEGQADYLPMDELEVAQVEAGPQGGYHIWVAVRLKNLHRSGSITEISGSVPDLNLDLTPFAVIFTFDQDEGGYCKLYGLRFQLDDQVAIEEMLGKTVNVKVTITDSDGDVGVGERLVTLSDTTI